MRKPRLGLLFAVLLLVTAPGCRVLAGAAVIAGEAALDAVLDDDGCDCHPAKHHSTQGRADRRSADPCR